jgi:para-aminobenzoate synthetase component 2
MTDVNLLLNIGNIRQVSGAHQMVLVIDNFDSFTYNLVQYLLQLNVNVKVLRVDEFDPSTIETWGADAILISPGPGNPASVMGLLQYIRRSNGGIPILGVCLGHQIIAHAFGGIVTRAETPAHGKVSTIHHDGRGLFHNIKSPLRATRYHSLIVDAKSLPGCFEVSAVTQQGEIMAIRHKEFRIEGVQFHPESIMTESGHQMLRNFFLSGV